VRPGERVRFTLPPIVADRRLLHITSECNPRPGGDLRLVRDSWRVTRTPGVYVLTVVFGRGPDGVITEQGSVWVLVSKTAPLRLRPVNTVHCPPT